eukprot:scaffold23232_cov131-Isochrysis_galbana.AAC.3
MRSGTLSDSSVRKFCRNLKRDDTFDVTRIIPATRSSKRAARSIHHDKDKRQHTAPSTKWAWYQGCYCYRRGR